MQPRAASCAALQSERLRSIMVMIANRIRGVAWRSGSMPRADSRPRRRSEVSSLSHRVERVAHQTPAHRAGAGGAYLNRVLGRPHRHLRGVGERGVPRADPRIRVDDHRDTRAAWWGRPIALHGVRRAVVPVIGGLLAGLAVQYGAALISATRSVDSSWKPSPSGDGITAGLDRRPRSQRSLLTIASGGSIGREGPMVQPGRADRFQVPRRSWNRARQPWGP